MPVEVIKVKGNYTTSGGDIFPLVSLRATIRYDTIKDDARNASNTEARLISSTGVLFAKSTIGAEVVQIEPGEQAIIEWVMKIDNAQI